MQDFETPLPFIGFPLVGRARFRVTGTDHLRYLNGQLTQDLKKVTHQLALPACITSAKGRLQAEVWVLAEVGSSGQAALLVDAPGELREALLGRLERYIVADDVSLEDVTGVSELLHFPLTQLPDIPELEPFVAAKAARLGGAGWDVWVPADKFGSLCAALGGRLGSAQDFERLRVQRGIPAWGAELTEDTLPPEAGLDKTHVDYHKGCYIGQEVISRLKSVGHVNRALQRFTGGQTEALPPTPMGASGLPCSAGESLYEQGKRDKVVGTLTSVTADSHGGMCALGYVKRGVEAERFETEKGVQLFGVPNTAKHAV
jgi:folate-binding protein YgfZ